MLPRTTDRTPRRGPLLAAALLVAAALVAGDRPARAQGVKTDSSLSFIPADAAFYSTSLRNREQVELFLKSNAFKALHDLPAVKMGLAKLHEEPKFKEGISQFHKFLEDKDNKDLADVLLQAVSDEVFFYGGRNWNDFIRVLGRLNAAQQWSAIGPLSMGNFEGMQKAPFRAMLAAAQKDRELISVPEFVIGFKLKDTKKAVAQLERLEKFAGAILEGVPPLKGKFKRAKAAGGHILALELDSSLIPWNDIDLKELEEKKDEFEDLIKHLKKLTLTISLGVKGDYLLLAITGSSKDLEKLGKGKSLAEREEMAPLTAHAGKPLTGIGYVSKELLGTAAAMSMSSIEELSKQGKAALERTEALKEERKKAILKDLDRYLDEAKKSVQTPGARMDFSYMTSTGYEGYHYDFGKHEGLKGLKSQLHHHFGGDPLFAAAVGFRADGSGYSPCRRSSGRRSATARRSCSICCPTTTPATSTRRRPRRCCRSSGASTRSS